MNDLCKASLLSFAPVVSFSATGYSEEQSTDPQQAFPLLKQLQINELQSQLNLLRADAPAVRKALDTGVGEDFHHDNVRVSLMTQCGLYSETMRRNDPGPARGQRKLADAYHLEYNYRAANAPYFGGPRRSNASGRQHRCAAIARPGVDSGSSQQREPRDGCHSG